MTKVQLSYDRSRRAGCYGLDMPDGSRYTVDRSGRVDIERKDHLRALKRTGLFSTAQPVGFASLGS
jgi:hypothetical protein